MKKKHYIYSVIFCFVLAILQVNSTVWFRLKLADYYKNKGQDIKAMEIYEKILRKIEVEVKNPLIQKDNPYGEEKRFVYKELSANYKNRDAKKAIGYYEKSAKINPETEENYIQLCSLYLKEGDVLKVIKPVVQYEKSFRKRIPVILPENAELYYQLGIAFSKEKIWEEAVEAFKKTVKLDTGFADAYYQLGRSQENMGQTDLALDNYRKTADLLPAHFSALKKLEEIYSGKGLVEEKNRVRQAINGLIPAYKSDVNLDDKIKFLGYDIIPMENGMTKFVFWFKCINKMVKNYSVWFHGEVRDKSILEPDRLQYGFANFDHDPEKYTSQWQIGEVYKDTYVRKINSGEYYLSFGIFNKMDNTNERLYDKKTAKDFISIGWIKIM